MFSFIQVENEILKFLGIEKFILIWMDILLVLVHECLQIVLWVVNFYYLVVLVVHHLKFLFLLLNVSVVEEGIPILTILNGFECLLLLFTFNISLNQLNILNTNNSIIIDLEFKFNLEVIVFWFDVNNWHL